MPGDPNKPPGKKPGPKVLFRKEGTTEGEQPQTAPPPSTQPHVPFGTPQTQKPLRGSGPKVIAAGAIRNRIPCTLVNLQEQNANASSAILARALRLVEGINLDDAFFDDIVRFGSDVQIAHGHIAESELAIANDPALRTGQTILATMLRVVQELDPETVFATRSTSILEVLRDLASPKPDPQIFFEEKYPELLQLAQQLGAYDSTLQEVAKKLLAFRPRYTALIEEISSFTIAGNFIVQYVRSAQFEAGLQPHYASQADALENRVSSLLGTRTTLEMGLLTNQTLGSMVETLIAAGRGMLEENLPAFHTAYTTALVATVQQGSKTELSTLRNVYARILAILQGV